MLSITTKCFANLWLMVLIHGPNSFMQLTVDYIFGATEKAIEQHVLVGFIILLTVLNKLVETVQLHACAGRQGSTALRYSLLDTILILLVSVKTQTFTYENPSFLLLMCFFANLVRGVSSSFLDMPVPCYLVITHLSTSSGYIFVYTMLEESLLKCEYVPAMS